MRTNDSNPPNQEDALWDVKDVAAYLKASRSWVYQRAEAGLLPCLRIGGLLRFDPASIRAHARGERLEHARVIPLVLRRRK